MEEFEGKVNLTLDELDKVSGGEGEDLEYYCEKQEPSVREMLQVFFATERQCCGAFDVYICKKGVLYGCPWGATKEG